MILQLELARTTTSMPQVAARTTTPCRLLEPARTRATRRLPAAAGATPTTG